ncbi:hypothetical protein DPMN_009121 [Dreissena polymorpha]|uniref:Uncharacterized protein n=1 Tax=Dreissena polymorpha TaxID=45954 RepID=A0A9D4MZY9_DREPO|nr:hypothetical protein DPMN_009121 [Dreissena polymorpha]
MDILLELVIENKNLLQGKKRAIGDRGKQAEKVAGDCGNHKRVWGGVEESRHVKKLRDIKWDALD